MLLTLGPLELATGQFDRPKSLLLLAFLALEGPQSRARLRTLFWPAGADPALQLRVTLNRLRTALPESLTMKGEVLSTPLPCDAKALLNAFEAGNDPEVVRLYRACFLDGLTLPNLGEELEEWMFTTRETLAARARTSILRLSVQQARETHFRVAADWAARAWALKEAPEPAASTLLDLHDLLLAGEHPDAPLVAHELTQLNLPITTSVQVARSRFARPPPKLPPLLRATVGRQSEVQEVLAWLTNPQERGVVINGPDGIGKTHLALEIAHTWPAPPGQAPLWLPLGSTPDPVVAGKTLLHLLNPDWQGHLNELQDMTTTLNLHVTEPRLLVLDAAEALTAPQAFLTALLQVPNLRLLVTSSERLHLPRLPEYNLNGLKCHPEDTPTSQPSDAARLFLQNLNGPREQTELNTTAPVEGIVRLLRGYPLAILLASSWASTLSPAQLLNELEQRIPLLDDRVPAGSISPKLVFEHAWKKLPLHLQQALMNLTAFNGTFSRRAATDLLGISVTQLAQLTDRHFLVVQDERFKFYPLVSEYLQPHLQLQQHQNLQARSAAYFLSLLQTRNCTPEDFKDALNAWQYALQHQQWEALHAATSGLRWLGHQSGRQRETAEALRQALPVLERLHPSWAATLGTNLAWLEMRLGLGEQAIRSAQTALNHAQTPQEQLRSRLVLISALRHTGARTEARHHLKAQINQAEGSEDTRALRQAQELLAVLEEESGNAAQAEMIYLNLLATSREQQPEELARVLHNYANSLLNQSRPAEARTMLQEALILLPADHAYKPIIQLHLADADRQERHFARTLNTCTALMPLLAEQPNLSALVYEVQARTLLDLQRPQAAVQAARQALLLTWRVGLIPKVLEQLAVSVEILLTFPEPTRDTQRLHAALLARPELPNWSRKNLPPCRESTSMPLVEMVSLCLQELADQHNKFPTGGH